jgi:hypothetical protein
MMSLMLSGELACPYGMAKRKSEVVGTEFFGFQSRGNAVAMNGVPSDSLAVGASVS